MPNQSTAFARSRQKAPPADLSLGLAKLATSLYRTGDASASHAMLSARLAADPNDAAALLELSILLQLSGRAEAGLMCQAQALAIQQNYHLPADVRRGAHVRLLMFAVPGNFMSNMPVEFLIDGLPASLDTLYLLPGQPIPQDIPEHDIALVGIAEAAETHSVLMGLAPILATWPKPVLNAPGRILDLARERLFEVLADCRGVEIPATARVSRDAMASLATGAVAIADLLPDAAFPIIARPAGSHAGNGLEKIDTPEALIAYLAQEKSAQFYISRFIDYSSADGQFRKYRVVSVGGRPFLCHMAIARHWMLHYLNAGMHEDAAKRAEEAQAMAGFDEGFGARHGQALSDIARALDLDYFVLDCAETQDGKLLVFEAGTAMIVHKMDAPDMFPYKAPVIDKICNAFVEMLAFRVCEASIKANLR